VILRAEQSWLDMSLYSHTCTRSKPLDGSSPVGCNCKVMMFFWEPYVSSGAVSVLSLLIYYENVESTTTFQHFLLSCIEDLIVNRAVVLKASIHLLN